MICILPYTNQTKDNNINDSNLLFISDKHIENEYIDIDQFLKLIFSQHNISSTTINHCIFKNKYRVSNYTLSSYTTRETALIDLMRSYMLIPDPDKINLYPWDDIPNNTNLSKQDLAYISYAKELGITKGYTDSTFGFNMPITKWQLNTFIKNIENVKKSLSNQVEYGIQCISYDKNKHLDELAFPIVIEYLYSLPNNVETAIKNNNWTVVICNDTIPGYEKYNAIGLTNLDICSIYLISTAKYSTYYSFEEILIHEFGHVINNLANLELYQNDEIIKEQEKLSRAYRPYANESMSEYIACAWTWLYYIGDIHFSNAYPNTYKFIQKMISSIN